MMHKLRIVIGGYIGLYPTGGATLDYIQFPLGLKLMGHDVYYIEDTMQYPVYQENEMEWNDASGCIKYLSETMNYFGMSDRWAYRDIATGRCYGMPLNKVLDICNSADIFINISCSTVMRDEYFRIPKRILIDSDPMFTQVTYFNELNGENETTTKKLIETHNYLFTFGENIGSSDCRVPAFNLKWLKTRQPVCMDLWRNNESVNMHGFTSIMNWSGRRKMRFMNEDWGQKDVEFEKYIKVPATLPDLKFKVVINPPLNPESTFDIDEIIRYNWQVVHPRDSVANFIEYAQFIKTSFAEFSIAKETYVKSNSGWFSCRSACYLAAGKPVVAEETGWSKYIPAGMGLLTFSDINTAVESIKSVSAHPEIHSKAAVEIARNFFDSELVLKKMIDQLN